MHAWLIALLLMAFPWDNSRWGPTRQQELVDLENIRQVCMPQFRAFAPNFTNVEMMGYDGRIMALRMVSTQIEPNLLKALSDDEIATTRQKLRDMAFLPRGPGATERGINPQVIANIYDCAFKQRLCQAGRTKYCGGGSAKPSAPALRPNVAAKPRPAPLAQKLPPARPAKMAPWSPRAMPTNPKQLLSPRYAAERADALASCPAPIQQWAAIPPVSAIAEANLALEQAWLNDSKDMSKNREQLKGTIGGLEQRIAAGGTAIEVATRRAGLCLYQRRVAQLEGSPLATGAVDGTLTPLSIGGQTPSRTQQGKDARVIASDGKSAMDCVRLERLGGDSSVGGGGRVLVNGCSDEVEIAWCYWPGDCTTETGSSWTVQPGRSWPVKAASEVRWAACLGRDTASFVKGSYGLRYYCKAPAKK